MGDFLDILFRGLGTLCGRKRSKDESLFETGQDVVAGVIVVGGIVALLVWMLYLMFG